MGIYTIIHPGRLVGGYTSLYTPREASRWVYLPYASPITRFTVGGAKRPPCALTPLRTVTFLLLMSLIPSVSPLFSRFVNNVPFSRPGGGPSRALRPVSLLADSWECGELLVFLTGSELKVSLPGAIPGPFVTLRIVCFLSFCSVLSTFWTPFDQKRLKTSRRGLPASRVKEASTFPLRQSGCEDTTRFTVGS